MSRILCLRSPCRRVARNAGRGEPQHWLIWPTQRRNAHTAGFADLPSWPTAKHPTPYEIFHTSKETIDCKAVRTHFYTLAKVYHPDSLHDALGLTPELKEERFKQIVAAYDILRDEKKRKDYDLFSKGWEYGDKNAARKNFYGRDFSRAAKYRTDGGFHASNPRTGSAWDDFHQDYKDYQKQQDPQYQKESWENHKRMVVFVTAGCLLVGAIQVKFLMHNASKDIEARNRLSTQVRHTVYMANNNYGMGFDKGDRIQRFLAHRDGTTSYDNYKEMHLAQEAEKLALPSGDTKP